MDLQFIQEALRYLKSIAQGVNNPWAIWIPLMGVLVALLLGIVGIFQDRIRSWFRKPNLKISIKVEPPDCHMIPLTKKETGEVIDDVYYLRFRINNSGNQEARDVQVIVTELYEFNNRECVRVDSFLPLNLVWSHTHEMSMENRMIMKTIPEDVFRHCDLGYLTHSHWKDHLLSAYPLKKRADVILKMDTIVEPNTGSHIIFPGKYRLTVYVSASNAKTLKTIFEIEVKDIWNNLGKKMVALRSVK